MPITTAKKVAKKVVSKTAAVAARSIRTHWSDQEAARRHEMAELMQQRLLEALGLTHTTVNKPR